MTAAPKVRLDDARRVLSAVPALIDEVLHRMPDPLRRTPKGRFDYSTAADFAVQEAITEHLVASGLAFPIVAEEDYQGGPMPEIAWVIDPIDGTINYSRGHPLHACSVSLAIEGRARVALLYFPSLARTYSAVEDGGASCGGQPLRCSAVSTLSDAVICLGDFADGENTEARNVPRLKVVERLADRCLRVRMHGSAAADHCFVACGAADASVTLSNKPWDTLGGSLIVREAGGQTLDLAGHQHDAASSATVTAASAALAAELIEALGDLED